MRRLFVLATVLLLPACAEVQMANTEADVLGRHSRRSLVKLRSMSIAEGMLARAVKMSVSVNGSRLGALAQDTWFRVDLEPGQYVIGCTSAENSEARNVQLAADEIRFIEIEPRFGIKTPRCAVVETTSESGRAGVLAGYRAQELADPSVAKARPVSINILRVIQPSSRLLHWRTQRGLSCFPSNGKR